MTESPARTREPDRSGQWPATRFVVATTVFCLWYSSALLLLTGQIPAAVRGFWFWGAYGFGAIVVVAVALPAALALHAVVQLPCSGGQSEARVRREPATLLISICFLWWPAIYVQERLLGFGFPGINFLIPIALFAALLHRRRRTSLVEWLRLGRFDWISWLVTGGVIVVSGAALIGWSALGAQHPRSGKPIARCSSCSLGSQCDWVCRLQCNRRRSYLSWGNVGRPRQPASKVEYHSDHCRALCGVPPLRISEWWDGHDYGLCVGDCSGHPEGPKRRDARTDCHAHRS